MHQKGYVIYCPGSRSIVISDDVIFDEHFHSAIAQTWQKYQDGIALRPIASFIPDVTTTLEETGSIADAQASVEEEIDQENDLIDLTTPFQAPEAPANDVDDTPDLVPQHDDDFSDSEDDDDDSVASNDSDEDEEAIFSDDDLASLIQPTPVEPEADTPQILRHSTRPRKPNPKYAQTSMASTVGWTNLSDDPDLQEACAAELHAAPMPTLNNTLSWEPAPKTIRDILKMPDGPVKTAWLQSVRKEFKTLIDNNTFVHDTPRPGEAITPIMETFRVKILSDGSLDKLKTRIVVRGDLQSKTLTEDKWSPTASFRALKMFLAHASRVKARIKQLDFVGAFLQAKTRSRVFISIPPIHGILFPEYKEYCGKPIRLAKSMYGMTLSGKYWFLDLQEHLLQLGFKPSSTVPCLFIKEDEDGDKIYVLNYVDDMLYYGTNDVKVKQDEESLQARFSLELMGQAHWYLSTRINQLSNYNIELDQTRYCKAIVKKYLDSAGTKRDAAFHPTPLPLDFIPTADDCSVNEAAVQKLESEYNVEYASCIGSLIYLGMTRCDTVYAINKLAKYSKKPGRKHFEAMFHLLRYLRDHSQLGIKFYNNYLGCPLYATLKEEQLIQSHPFFAFSDSSWNDDVDHGRSTGCYIITYMGEIVDHSSNLPNPVTLSSAEAEYNEGCLAMMATSHLRMLLAELEGLNEDNLDPTSIYFDSKSAIAMGNSFKDTKQVSLCQRRYTLQTLCYAMDQNLSSTSRYRNQTKPRTPPCLSDHLDAYPSEGSYT